MILQTKMNTLKKWFAEVVEILKTVSYAWVQFGCKMWGGTA